MMWNMTLCVQCVIIHIFLDSLNYEKVLHFTVQFYVNIYMDLSYNTGIETTFSYIVWLVRHLWPYTEMHSNRNINISLPLVCFHYLFFISRSNMNPFDECLLDVVRNHLLCTFFTRYLLRWEMAKNSRMKIAKLLFTEEAFCKKVWHLNESKSFLVFYN